MTVYSHLLLHELWVLGLIVRDQAQVLSAGNNDVDDERVRGIRSVLVELRDNAIWAASEIIPLIWILK